MLSVPPGVKSGETLSYWDWLVRLVFSLLLPVELFSEFNSFNIQYIHLSPGK